MKLLVDLVHQFIILVDEIYYFPINTFHVSFYCNSSAARGLDLKINIIDLKLVMAESQSHRRSKVYQGICASVLDLVRHPLLLSSLQILEFEQVVFAGNESHSRGKNAVLLKLDGVSRPGFLRLEEKPVQSHIIQGPDSDTPLIDFFNDLFQIHRTQISFDDSHRTLIRSNSKVNFIAII